MGAIGTTSDEDRDAVFTAMLARGPELGARAARIMSREEGLGGRLLARRILERDLGAGPDGIAGRSFRE
ncbi:MAG: hypothetical protein J2P25_25855, partial [Nocardiopsaceae bacterium]|nr:hypothetical protein [Nocardiopsaceae bacterium]